jgi:hypothetical protein
MNSGAPRIAVNTMDLRLDMRVSSGFLILTQ